MLLSFTLFRMVHPLSRLRRQLPVGAPYALLNAKKQAHNEPVFLFHTLSGLHILIQSEMEAIKAEISVSIPLRVYISSYFRANFDDVCFCHTPKIPYLWAFSIPVGKLPFSFIYWLYYTTHSHSLSSIFFRGPVFRSSCSITAVSLLMRLFLKFLQQLHV